MALTIPTRTATSIGLIKIDMRDPNGENPQRTIDASVDVLDQDGEKMQVWRGDLRPHLTSQQLSALAAFMDALRSLAEDGLLPGE